MKPDKKKNETIAELLDKPIMKTSIIEKIQFVLLTECFGMTKVQIEY